MKKYSLRNVQQSDIETLAEIMSASFTPASPDHPWAVEYARDYLVYWLEKQPDMFFLAEYEGEIVGAIAASMKPWRTGVRVSEGVMFTAIGEQMQGVGKQLAQKLLTRARDEYNATSVELITFAGSDFPKNMFEKVGMKPDEHALFMKGDLNEVLGNLEK